MDNERIELESEVSKIVGKSRRRMVRVVGRFGVYLSLILTTGTGLAQSQLDLVIPSFEVQDATVEQTVRELLRWGIQVGLAVESGKDEIRVARSFSYQDISIRDVLDIVTEEYPDCKWEAYQSKGLPHGIVVNVDCISEDTSHLLEVYVEDGRIEAPSASTAINYIQYYVAPLTRKLYPNGYAASVLSGVGQKIQAFKVDFKFCDLTVREVLNEIALRSGGLSWIYTRDRSADKHVWRVLLP